MSQSIADEQPGPQEDADDTDGDTDRYLKDLLAKRRSPTAPSGRLREAESEGANKKSGGG